MRALASAAGLAGLCLLVAARPALARDPADPADTRQVAARYVLHCGGCHGVDGRGTPGATPTLHGLAALADTEDGHRYLMRVPGVAQAPLADADLAELLDWLVATFSDEPVGHSARQADQLFEPVHHTHTACARVTHCCCCC